MRGMYRSLVFPILRHIDPETAHGLAVRALRCGLAPAPPLPVYPQLAMQVSGVTFPNPVGMAAGFDKNGEVIAPLLCQGFGFVECGTVTPLPQPGNPRPRMFRLTRDRAVINRLGFNSGGLEAFLPNLKRARPEGVVGINIGKNKDTGDPLKDYRALLRAVYGKSDYITVNISSPNTPGLRALQAREALEPLVAGLMEERVLLTAKTKRSVPVFLKIAPDISPEEIMAITEITRTYKLDGLIVGNTTVTRPGGLKSAARDETGGLSGKPLFTLSTRVLRDVYRACDGAVPLVGVGGIETAEDAYAKIRAGASLVQLYTALVYEGFGLVPRIIAGLADMLRRDGFASLKDAVGADAR